MMFRESVLFGRRRSIAATAAGVLALLLSAAPGAAASSAAQPAPAASLPEKQSVQVFGQTIRYFDVGQGPVIVMLHGLGSHADIDWGQVMPVLARTHRVLALDQVGFGSSAKPLIGYHIQTWVDFLAEFLRIEKVDHFALAGESLGGWIAAQYTIEALSGSSQMARPDHLILSDAAGLPMQLDSSVLGGLQPASLEDMRTSLKNVFYSPAFSTDEAVRAAFTSKLAQGDGYTVHATLESMMRSQEFVDDKLSAITIPTLVVWGANDRLLPVEAGQKYAEGIAGARLVVVPECGHAPAVEKPQAYLAAGLPFLGAGHP
jgi:triacylglycerol lipase